MNTATHQLAANVDASSHPWDIAAAGWNRHSAMIREWLHPATQMMLDEAHIKLGSRVLDIAAGAGDQTLDIAHRVGSDGHVLATDISPAILALAKKNAHISGLKQITTLVADAQSLGLAGANFDAAVCRLGLMFCRSPEAALIEIGAALRPNGKFCAVVFGEPALNPCLTMAISTARKHAGLVNLNTSEVSATASKDPFEPGTLMSLSKPGLFEKLLQKAGYIDITVHFISAPFHAPNVEHYIDFLRSSASPVIEILAPLSDSAQQNAWIEMTERLRVFSSTSSWAGPNGLQLYCATAP
jgi:ubiquinone/menaquinone biosynthesis C-methylase UbiE